MVKKEKYHRFAVDITGGNGIETVTVETTICGEDKEKINQAISVIEKATDEIEKIIKQSAATEGD